MWIMTASKIRIMVLKKVTENLQIMSSRKWTRWWLKWEAVSVGIALWPKIQNWWAQVRGMENILKAARRKGGITNSCHLPDWAVQEEWKRKHPPLEMASRKVSSGERQISDRARKWRQKRFLWSLWTAVGK